MQTGRADRQAAYAAKAREELGALTAQGAIMAGNAFSPVLFLKGAPEQEEHAQGSPLCGADGKALRASLAALGYAPEEWCALLSVDAHGDTLDPLLLREAIAVLDPSTLIICDEEAANAVRNTYADDLAALDDFEQAMLVPGKLAQLLGIRTINLGGFAAALGDPHEKQVMWARLKLVPPLGAPY